MAAMKKVHKWILIGVSLIFLTFILAISAALFFSRGTSVPWGELPSPNGRYLLLVRHVYPSLMFGGGGQTYFHLTRNTQLARQMPGLRNLLGKDVLVIEGFDLPYGIVWRSDSDLLIKLAHPIEKEFEYAGGRVKMYRSKATSWRQVKIAFGLIDERRDPHELRISTPIGLGR